MSVVVWAIGGQTLEQLGLEFAGGTFATGSASEMSLRRVGPFDAAHLFAYDQAVTLTRNGAPYFSGKVKSRPAFGSGGSEGQSIRVRDAWADLEDTIYLEGWAVGSGSVDLPIAVLGLNDEGIAIAAGTQIIEAINFAIGAGVDLQLGSVPTGTILWPSEVRNVSVAEVIRLSCRFHPDWVPWIDHSTSPPTFNVTPRASLGGSSGSIGGNVTDFDIVRRDDLVPEAVRITYMNATIIDGVTYRDGIVDKYPVMGPDSGPRVLSTVIDLAGGQMQFQKSRVQTRTLPDSQSEAKAYLKAKFPQLAAVADGHFTVATWEKSLVEETDEHAEAINPRAERLPVDDATDLPRELVRGTIEDWMRRKVGKVMIKTRLQADEDATAAEKAILERFKGLEGGFTVTATNAVTKIYKGITQWVAAEVAPEGIAQAVYEALEAYQYEGSATMKAADVTATRFHGTKFNLVNGDALASMNAVVHSASFDIDAGTVTVSVGPAPALGAEDFLEMQRMFRARFPTWMSEDERTSNELGAENDAGSRGDTVSGYDQPETTMMPGGGGGMLPGASIVPESFHLDDEEWSVVFSPGVLWEHSFVNAGLTHAIKIGADNIMSRPKVPLSSGANAVWIKWDYADDGTVTGDAIVSVGGSPPSPALLKPERPDGGTPGTHVQQLGVITVTDDGLEPTWDPHSPHVVANCMVTRILHVGDGLELWQAWDGGIDKWRTFKQLVAGESTGVDIIDTTAADIEGGALSIDWRQIAERATSTGIEPQIHPTVSSDGKAVEIRGNGYSATISAPVTALSIVDGLVTGAGSTAPPEDVGIHVNLTIVKTVWSEVEATGGPASYALVMETFYSTIYIRNGRVVGISFAEGMGTNLGAAPPDDTGIDIEDIADVKASYNVPMGTE